MRTIQRHFEIFLLKLKQSLMFLSRIYSKTAVYAVQEHAVDLFLFF